MPSPPRLFVCYAREDTATKDEIVASLRQLEPELVDVWVDEGIPGGADWERTIFGSIDRAGLAVVLVSQALMASDFVKREELPRLLGSREERGLRLHVVHLEPSRAGRLDVRFAPRRADGRGSEPVSLASIQYAHTPHPSLAGLAEAPRRAAIQKVVDAVERDARIAAVEAELTELARTEEGAARLRSAVHELLGDVELPDFTAAPAAAVLRATVGDVGGLPEVIERLAALKAALPGPLHPRAERWRGRVRLHKRLRAAAVGLVALGVAVPVAGWAVIRTSGWSVVGPSVVGEARCESGDGVVLRARNPSALDATLVVDKELPRLVCGSGSPPAKLWRGPKEGAAGPTCVAGVGNPQVVGVPAGTWTPTELRVCMLPPELGCGPGGARLRIAWEGGGLRSEPEEVRCTVR